MLLMDSEVESKGNAEGLKHRVDNCFFTDISELTFPSAPNTMSEI